MVHAIYGTVMQRSLLSPPQITIYVVLELYILTYKSLIKVCCTNAERGEASRLICVYSLSCVSFTSHFGKIPFPGSLIVARTRTQ